MHEIRIAELLKLTYELMFICQLRLFTIIFSPPESKKIAIFVTIFKSHASEST